MPKYIELEKAINLFYPVDPENDGSDGSTTVLKSEKYSSEEIESMLSELPAADVAPVVHAFWNSDEKCSACGEKSTEGLDAEKWNYWLPPFCPHCGAKMDFEENPND